jgi:hypothetical protein
VEIKQ